MEEQNIVDVTETEKVPAEPSTEKQEQDEKKYTDAEVDAIIDKKFAKWKAEQEAKEAEDKKLSKMNDSEKAEHEKQKLLDQIKQLEDEKTLFNMTAVARGMLAESNITLSDELLGQLVTLDAEQTKANIESFTEAFKAAVSEEVNKTIRQGAPHLGGGVSQQTNFGANLAKNSKPSGTLV